METLKIRIRKEIYTDLLSGKTNELSVKLTQTLIKNISSKENATVEDLEDENNVKKFDNLHLLCMLTSDSMTVGIKSMKISNGNLNVVIEKEVENKVEEKKEEVKKEKSVVKKEKKKSSISERINKVLDNFCNNKNVFIVGTPRVIVKTNGVLFGLKKRLPINNDVEVHIDIEKQKFFFTYDMTEDMFIKEFENFLNKMVIGNFVFIWRKKCIYKEVDGKRYLVLYYTTRKFINQDKKIW